MPQRSLIHSRPHRDSKRRASIFVASRGWSIVLLGGLLSAALACQSRDGAAQRASSSEPAVTAPPSSRAEPSAAPVMQGPRSVPSYALGKARTYSLGIKSEAAAEGSPLTQFELTATLELVCVEKSEDRALLYAILQSPRLSTRLEGKQAEFTALEPELSKPFLIEVGPGGRTDAVYLYAPSPLGAGMRHTIAAALQGVPRGTPGTWIQSEWDATGRYASRYAETSPGKLSKEKLGYGTGRAAEEPQAAAKAPRIKSTSASSSSTMHAS